MSWKTEWKKLAWLLGAFLICFWMPVGVARFDSAVVEALELTKWYAREHVVLCLIPAFFIAGAIAVFLSRDAVMRYLGPKANRALAYGVASVSGSILAVCSCTVLPLFAGIYRVGAGLGPAMAFLYSGPAINVLAIILTARVLGLELGMARAVGAILFSVVIGAIMHLIYRKEEARRADPAPDAPESEVPVSRPLSQNGLCFGAMIAVLIFANRGEPQETDGVWFALYQARWMLTAGAASGLAVVLTLWFGMPWWKTLFAAVPSIGLALVLPDEPMIAFAAGLIGLSVITSMQAGEGGEWFLSSWVFAKQIMPLLLVGVFLAGALLGRPGHEGLVPSRWVADAVGGNSIQANLFASVAGAFMYFATLTEVPILEGLIGSGMGKGPALALLLAGPALSLPNRLVIRSIIGTPKTSVFVALVIVMATAGGMIYGTIFD